MAATLHNLIKIGCEKAYEGSTTSSFKQKLDIIAAQFTSLKGFKEVTIKTLNNLKSIEGNQLIKSLTAKESKAITRFQRDIELDKSIVQHFIKILTREFVNKQISMLSTITIDDFNANPILCAALNLKTTEEFIRYNAYQAIGRSIVTSMGYLVQNLLLYSNEYVFDGKGYNEGDKTKFDLVIDRLGEVKSFLEIKSGFNDMDAGQVKHYADEISLVEKDGHKGYIGITYGKKDDTTVTAGLLKNYLPDWDKKTLVGRELWDFISKNDHYHEVLINSINLVANSTLKNISIVKKIEEKIKELIKTFDSKYGSLPQYYESLW